MLGYLVFGGSFRLRLYREEVCTLPLLRAEVPGTAESHRAERRVRHACQILSRCGVTRLLEGGIPGSTLPEISTRELWQAVAAPLALAYLRRYGPSPERASVALRGRSFSSAMRRAALSLSDAVRALSLETPGGEALTWALQRELGLPAPGGAADLTVCFSPEEPGEGKLCLGDDRPQVAGILLTAPGISIPDACPSQGLLAALYAAGRITPEDFLPDFVDDFPTLPGKIS